METIVLNIISSIIYSILSKTGVFVKRPFIEMIESEFQINGIDTAEQIAIEVEKLNLSDDLSEKVISRRIEESNNIQQLVEKLNYNQNSVIQNHSGDGDNVAGNKNIYNNKE